jgi:hypothetical protein
MSSIFAWLNTFFKERIKKMPRGFDKNNAIVAGASLAFCAIIVILAASVFFRREKITNITHEITGLPLIENPDTESALSENLPPGQRRAEPLLQDDEFFYDEFYDELNEFYDEDGLWEDGEIFLAEDPDALVQPPLLVLDAAGSLLRHEDESDIFALLSLGAANPEYTNTGGSLLSMVTGDGEQFTRSKYDSKLRLVSRTVWQKAVGATVAADSETLTAEPVKQSVYFYADDYAKNASRREVYSFSGNSVETTEYTLSGFPLRITVSTLSEQNQNEVTAVSNTSYVYDAENRVIEKQSQRFGQAGGAQIEEIRYDYTEKADTPDTQIYRDGTLIHSIVYEENGTYTETRILSEGFSVQTRYEHDTLVEEVFFQNGKIARRREY